MASKPPLHPLEGDREDEEVRFFVYDKIGRALWGEMRVRRMKNPDVLVIECRQDAQSSAGPVRSWKPILHVTAVDGKLLAATFGIHGGVNDPATGPNTR